MTAAWDGPDSPTGGVRPLAASSGRRLGTLAYDRLKERLLEGGYKAGERLSMEALKAEFQVSKAPVMDALRRLEADGLIEIIPQSGCRVPVHSAQSVADFFAVFGGMEGAVAGVAAQRRTESQLQELIAVNDQIKQLDADPDPAARAHGYRLLNRRFHAIIHAMAHSPVVSEISSRMWDRSDLLINTSGVPQPLASAVSGRHADHERIITALKKQDNAAARAEMEAHILGTIDVIHAEAASRAPGTA
ncbi:GntR family transcriptional regulator [Kribbella sp. NBC_00382]|uniref:GntR family transcriptional regulator n=1 Tax=Kribbella sp. NBC_00382 TaxID=2975967 RepID=UPI002E24F460